jgi:hypothetical protein
MSVRPSKKSRKKRNNAETNGHSPLTNGSTSHHDEHGNGDVHSHSHSHSLLLGSHSHGEEGHIEEHEKIIEALRGGGK